MLMMPSQLIKLIKQIKTLNLNLKKKNHHQKKKRRKKRKKIE